MVPTLFSMPNKLKRKITNNASKTIRTILRRLVLSQALYSQPLKMVERTFKQQKELNTTSTKMNSTKLYDENATNERLKKSAEPVSITHV